MFLSSSTSAMVCFIKRIPVAPPDADALVFGRLAFGTLEAEKGNILAWQGQALDATAQNVSGFRARCLLRGARWATLATGQGFEAGTQPFASLITHAVAPDGAVLMLLSSLAAHAGHLAANPRCAVMVTGRPENLNWQTAPRLTVMGHASIIDDPALRDYWLARHPYAALYAGFADFFLWRLAPVSGHFVSGFAQATELKASDLAPSPQAVAAVQAGERALLARCNTSHAEALNRVAHAAGATGPWRLLGVDVDGLDLVQDESVLRIAFPSPVADGEAARAALLQLLEVASRHF
jgi:putative heme iron utilization protein